MDIVLKIYCVVPWTQGQIMEFSEAAMQRMRDESDQRRAAASAKGRVS